VTTRPHQPDLEHVGFTMVPNVCDIAGDARMRDTPMTVPVGFDLANARRPLRA
jgi:hypothetical protein